MVSVGKAKDLFWMGDSRKKLKGFPEDVREVMGYGLFLAEKGGKHPNAKPLKGFGGAGVLEIVEDHDGNTFRAVYTVKLANAVYVLHAFQKKSKKGIATPKADLDLIKDRLKQARQHHAERIKQQEREG
jgi:phage-related protein